MRRAISALTAVAVVVAGGLTYAQEPAAEENVEYEKLKVLEGFVGEWSRESVNDEGETLQVNIKVFWSSSKKTLIDHIRRRRASKGQDITKQEWQDTQHAYYIWNAAKKRIEQVATNPERGVYRIFEVKPRGNGKLDYILISTTAQWKSDFTVDVAKDSYTVKFSNIVDAEGNKRDDMDIEWTNKRVK